MKEKELIEVNNELNRINDRVANIEQIATTIENLAEKGFEAFVKHMDHKEETQQKELELDNAKHQREIELEDTLHKRSVVIIGVTVMGIIGLVLTAMLIGEKELVKTILTSSFAVAAGFGIKSALKKSKGS